MDRNQVIGLTLIFGILFLYFQFLAPKTPIPDKNEISQTDTTLVQHQDKGDVPEKEIKDSTSLSIFETSTSGEEQEIIIENNELQVSLSTVGGRITQVWLKNYENDRMEPLYLIQQDYLKQKFLFPTKDGEVDLFKVPFAVAKKTPNSATFEAKTSNGKSISFTYRLSKAGFELIQDMDLKSLKGIGISTTNSALVWDNYMQQIESDLEASRNKATINYYTTEDGFDYLSETSQSTETELVEERIEWVSFKHKFFNAGIINPKGFSSAEVSTFPAPDAGGYVKRGVARLFFQTDSLVSENQRLKFYFGPNKMDLVADVTEGYHKNVELGAAVFAPINRYFVLPIFHFLEDFIGNYGLIVIILAFIVKLIIFPLSYKSYVGMAKTRVLKPEMDSLKEKYGDDMTKMQQEQMKLYQQFGINPLAGCIPLVLQMPILLSMFYFFPNIIELRHESFLWAEDLSVYDSILSLPFSIPAYGDHVSGFTLLVTISTIGLTFFNSQNQMSSMQGMQASYMKILSYFMPVVFMFVLNSYPAGLSLYYVTSNLITISQQLIIRQLVDEKKIRSQLEEKRVKRKNKPKSKFRQRLDNALQSAQEAQERQKEQQEKSRRRRK